MSNSNYNSDYAPLPWEGAHWLEEVTGWLDQQLAANGLTAVGPLEVVHQRPWSAFARQSTSGGMVYFKAPAPAFHYEAALTQFLARQQPGCTVPLLAVDPERGWILSADAGITLREAAPGAEQIEHWVRVLPLYVDLQIAMGPATPHLLAIGVPDRRLATFPHLFEQLLGDTHSLLLGQEGGLTPQKHRRLEKLKPRVGEMCEEVAAMGPPETLTHEEIHDVNVLLDRGDRYRFIDWSDASVAHPFFTLLVTVRAAAYRLGVPENGTEIARLRDAYLEPWTRFDTRAALSKALEVATPLAMINRSLSWYQGIKTLAPHHRTPYADSVPGWLQDFLVAVEE